MPYADHAPVFFTVISTIHLPHICGSSSLPLPQSSYPSQTQLRIIHRRFAPGPHANCPGHDSVEHTELSTFALYNPADRLQNQKLVYVCVCVHSAVPKNPIPKTIILKTTKLRRLFRDRRPVFQRPIFQRAIPKTAIPKTPLPKTTISKTAIPKTAIPNSAIPKTTKFQRLFERPAFQRLIF